MCNCDCVCFCRHTTRLESIKKLMTTLFGLAALIGLAMLIITAFTTPAQPCGAAPTGIIVGGIVMSLGMLGAFMSLTWPEPGCLEHLG